MKTLKRRTRSDKFPLTFHPTGQYCKKIKGKIYYFGSDKKQALEKYLNQAPYLHGCQNNLQQQKPTCNNMTLKQLCDMYLKYQYSKVQAIIILSPAMYNSSIFNRRCSYPLGLLPRPA